MLEKCFKAVSLQASPHLTLCHRFPHGLLVKTGWILDGHWDVLALHRHFLVLYKAIAEITLCRTQLPPCCLTKKQVPSILSPESLYWVQQKKMLAYFLLEKTEPGICTPLLQSLLCSQCECNGSNLCPSPSTQPAILLPKTPLASGS